jgi:hypothetical protein
MTKAAKAAKAANVFRITPLENLPKSVRKSGVQNLTPGDT